MEVEVGKEIQQSAEAAAREIRAFLDARRIFALNLVSSPGSGKTTLIEALIGAWRGRRRLAVIEGDIETEIDAERIRRHGVPVRQINTRSSCHIQPFMLRRALEEMDLSGVEFLFVENVGNLVCPAEVPLGEDVRVALLSVTEGDEKPLKYPLLFRTSQVLAITKTDLLPHVTFRVAAVRGAARAINPEIAVFELSAASGAGVEPFAAHLEALRARRFG